MFYNGLDVTPLVLGTALMNGKIEAIRLLRSGNGHPDDVGFIGLKAAKDAVEAAMADYESGSLRRELSNAQLVAQSYQATGERLAGEVQRLNREVYDLREARARGDREVLVLRALISDHMFGTAPLPVLTPPDDEPDYGESPY